MFIRLNKSLSSGVRIRLYHSKSGIFGYNPKTSRPSDQDYKIPQPIQAARNQQSNAFRWIEAYRKFGHKLATVDSVNFDQRVQSIEELNPEFYGLKRDEKVNTAGMVCTTSSESTVREIEEILNKVYCKNVSAEFSYIQNTEEKEWLSENYEKILQENITVEQQKQIAELLIKSQAFDNFLATKFPTVKRYGGEGAESMMAFFERIFELCGKDDVKHVVLGMPHRGRNNLLTTMLNVRPAKFFKKYQGNSEFSSDSGAMGDVASHYDASVGIERNGKSVHVSMLRNPSHLEAVNPVSMGKTRSKQWSLSDYSYGKNEVNSPSKVLNIQLHGDAAYPGQGVNQECLMMAYVPHFDVGGSIHMVVNNQIGFTTPAKRGRSTEYTTDLAKSVEAPVFHVNGDHPELVMLVTKLAFEYQRKFQKDVFIDLNCFRRWGHNELDDPTFTNPALYEIVNNRRSVPDLYADKLIQSNVLTIDDANKIRDDYMDYLNKELSATSTFEPEKTYFQQQWTGFQVATNSITYWDTGLDYSLLSYIGRQSVSYPKHFNIHPHLQKTHIMGRLKKLEEGRKIDWATAEALAIGSLLYQGYNVRLSGEDVGRGTFSHRHAMLVDQKLNEMYIPLNDMDGGLGGKLEIAHSILSEEAVLGFEYGMAIDNPNNLIIWEAQFGDFANGAQIIIDNFIATGETKWMQSNGMVMLLPHGFDGAASEHSSCRMERFLQLTDSKETAPDSDNVNLQVVNPSTPAQYFHVLRRQMVRDFRKPLVVVAPKILLRLSDAASTYSDFEPGKQFQNIIGDVRANPSKVTKVILCSGKHYYTLDAERTKQNIDNVAIIRVESLVPFPIYEIQEELKKFSNARKFIWSQEESRNAGAWSFVRPRFEYLIGKPLSYVGRAEGSTTATGDGKTHRMEAETILANTFSS